MQSLLFSNMIFRALFSFVVFILLFSLGWVVGALFIMDFYADSSVNSDGDVPEINVKRVHPLSPLTGLFVASSAELQSPSDHVKEEQIQVYQDKVVLKLDDPEWSSFTNTNSMDPFLDVGANAIELKPRSVFDIHIGDVVSYRPIQKDSGFASTSVVHRVVDVGIDKEGRYFLLKGDNNPVADAEKVRFEQIEGIVVAVVY